MEIEDIIGISAHKSNYKSKEKHNKQEKIKEPTKKEGIKIFDLNRKRGGQKSKKLFNIRTNLDKAMNKFKAARKINWNTQNLWKTGKVEVKTSFDSFY